jgi:hypothetical protein
MLENPTRAIHYAFKTSAALLLVQMEIDTLKSFDTAGRVLEWFTRARIGNSDAAHTPAGTGALPS